MIQTSKIKELLENEEFIKEVLEVIERAYEKTEEPAERINYVFHSFADTNESVVAVFYLGQYPILSMIEGKEK